MANKEKWRTRFCSKSYWVDSIKNKNWSRHLNKTKITLFFDKFFYFIKLFAEIVGWKLNCVDFIMSGKKSQEFKGNGIYFVVQKYKILFSIICRFEFGELRLLFLLIHKAWMDIDTHFFGKYLIIEIDVLLRFNECFELVLEIVKEMVNLIKNFLRVLKILPVRRRLEYGYNL